MFTYDRMQLPYQKLHMKDHTHKQPQYEKQPMTRLERTVQLLGIIRRRKLKEERVG